MNFALLLVLVLVLAALQVRLPAIPALGIQLEFLPALVAYGALTLTRPGLLALALLAGFANDALSAAPFGLTGLAYAAAALLIYGLRQALDRELPILQITAGVLVTVIASLAACFLAGYSSVRFFKIALLAALATLVTPVLFAALDRMKIK